MPLTRDVCGEARVLHPFILSLRVRGLSSLCVRTVQVLLPAGEVTPVPVNRSFLIGKGGQRSPCQAFACHWAQDLAAHESMQPKRFVP